MSSRFTSLLIASCLCLLTVAPRDSHALSATQRTLQAHLLRSYTLAQKKQYELAAKALLQLPRGLKQRYFVQLRLGWLRYLAGGHRHAIAHYQNAARLAPRAVEPLLGKMLPQMALRRWKDALQSSRQVLRKAPRNITALRRRAYILFSLGRYSKAIRAYRQAIELYPSDLTMQRGLAWSQLRAGKARAAINSFRAVLALSPSDRSAKAGLALAAKARR
jgi:tetratricopeptide (TPR) repeat protein